MTASSHPTAGFGFADTVAPAGSCGECPPGRPTDLFCRSHDRFLPMSGLGITAKAAVVITALAVFYGLVWVAAEIRLLAPIWVLATIIGLLVCVLPLRTHNRTVWLAGGGWLLMAVTLAVLHVSGLGLPSAGWLLLAALCAMPMHAFAIMSIQLLRSGAAAVLPGGPSNRMLVLIGAPLLALPGALLTVLAAPSLVGPGAADTVHRAGELAFTRGLLVGLLAAAVAGLIEGVRKADTGAPSVGVPRRPDSRTWRHGFSRVRRRPSGTAIDRIGEVTMITAIWALDLLLMLLTATGRTSVNLLIALAHIVLRMLVGGVNALTWAITMTMRLIGMATTSLLAAFTHSAIIAGSYLLLSLAAFVAPLAMLATGTVLVMRLAEHATAYLVDGRAADLWWLGLETVTGLVLLHVAWMLLAQQRLSDSVHSAAHSAVRLLPYVLIAAWLGCVVLGALTLLHLAKVPFGALTVALTVFLVLATVMSVLRRPAPTTSGP